MYILKTNISVRKVILCFIITFLRNSSGIPPGSFDTIFIASNHCVKPLSPGCGIRLNFILMSSAVMKSLFSINEYIFKCKQTKKWNYFKGTLISFSTFLIQQLTFCVKISKYFTKLENPRFFNNSYDLKMSNGTDPDWSFVRETYFRYSDKNLKLWLVYTTMELLGTWIAQKKNYT